MIQTSTISSSSPHHHYNIKSDPSPPIPSSAHQQQTHSKLAEIDINNITPNTTNNPSTPFCRKKLDFDSTQTSENNNTNLLMAGASSMFLSSSSTSSSIAQQSSQPHQFKKCKTPKNTAIVTGTIQTPPVSTLLMDYYPSKQQPQQTSASSGGYHHHQNQNHHRSGANGGGGGGGGYPKVPSNSKRNARERRRVRTINDYFSQLQKYLPHSSSTSSKSTSHHHQHANNSTTTANCSGVNIGKNIKYK